VPIEKAVNQSTIAPADPRSEFVLRIKDKQARIEAEKLAKDASNSASIRLRAYLSIAKFPPPDLITEENIRESLNIDDRVGFIPKLSTNVRLLNADVPMLAVVNSLKDIGPRAALRLTTVLARITKKWQQETSARLTDTTIRYFLQILEFLAKHQSEANAKDPAKTSFAQLLKTAVTLVSAAPPDTLIPTLRIFQVAETRAGIVVEKLVEHDQSFDRSLRLLTVKALNAIRELANQGRASEFELLYKLLDQLSPVRQELQLRMAEIYSQKARLPEPIQQSLKIIRGDTETPGSALNIMLDEEDATRTIQLASALLAAWVGKSDGPKSRDAFDELASVAANFFGLRLHGGMGDIEEYNPRVHEFTGNSGPSARVRLLRPWVEFSRQDKSKVILKAPVEAVQVAT
jgi:hypothetical protein